MEKKCNTVVEYYNYIIIVFPPTSSLVIDTRHCAMTYVQWFYTSDSSEEAVSYLLSKKASSGENIWTEHSDKTFLPGTKHSYSHCSSPAEPPKTANIRPISSSPACSKPQTVPVTPQSAASKVTASIRPMTIPPVTTTSTPTATVMPTTVSQPDMHEGSLVALYYGQRIRSKVHG